MSHQSPDLGLRLLIGAWVMPAGLFAVAKCGQRLASCLGGPWGCGPLDSWSSRIGLGTRATQLYEAAGRVRDRVAGLSAALALVERSTFETPLLVGLTRPLQLPTQRPSTQLRGLDTRLSLWSLREQGLLYFCGTPYCFGTFIACVACNSGTNVRVSTCENGSNAFKPLKPSHRWRVSFIRTQMLGCPRYARARRWLEATALGHPLLSKGVRVSNDVSVAGPGHVLPCERFEYGRQKHVA